MTTGLFNYIDPTSSLDDNGNRVKPWAKVDVDQTSFERSQHKRDVVDIRSAASTTSFGVDVSGFDVFKSPAKETEFTDDAAVRNGYYAEVEALLKQRIPGIKKVVIFDHTIRRREKSSPRQPVQQVHVDQTPGAAEARVRRHTDPSETEELLKGRYQIINVWRPIGHPATDFPLAVVDWRTTKPEDMIKVDLLYPKRDDNDDDDRGKEVLPDATTLRSTEGYQVKGETYSVAPNDEHKFYYAKDMTPEEVMLIKCFDSKSEVHEGGQHGLAGYTPHTAFVDPATPADAKGRQSIEFLLPFSHCYLVDSHQMVFCALFAHWVEIALRIVPWRVRLPSTEALAAVTVTVDTATAIAMNKFSPENRIHYISMELSADHWVRLLIPGATRPFVMRPSKPLPRQKTTPGLWKACRDSRNAMSMHFRAHLWGKDSDSLSRGERLKQASQLYVPQGHLEHLTPTQEIEAFGRRSDDEDSVQEQKSSLPASTSLQDNKNGERYMVIPTRDIFCIKTINYDFVPLDVRELFLCFLSPSGHDITMRHSWNLALESDPSWNDAIPNTRRALRREKPP
ncbi:7alpha-cephem-methoxylase P8 chain [Fusarium beomiforme]|uniref:7alpha-cephem-methoxylase P8 chain n=1 Tax=Fusarium beomiforme TaxID=44412 RepID=A0A9P5ANX0_9HYPO|nr:7alpha-cephem-methoxylase P8 chain [Fusarium beomiforme]